MVSETQLRLELERMSSSCWQPEKKVKPWVNIDMQKQMSIENISVWEINDGTNKSYRISMSGLAQNNYNDRVMIRGKQPERHVIGQYRKQDVTINMYPIIDYLSEEEQSLYLQLLSANNIRGCVEHLRKIETRLNLESEKELRKKSVRVRVRVVKKINSNVNTI